MSLTGILSDSSPMVTVSCATKSCGVEYLIPRHVYEQSRQLGEKRPLWCPNGHSWWWTESEADKLKRDLRSMEFELQRSRDAGNELRRERDRAVAQARYWKGIAHRKKRP